MFSLQYEINKDKAISLGVATSMFSIIQVLKACNICVLKTNNDTGLIQVKHFS